MAMEFSYEYTPVSEEIDTVTELAEIWKRAFTDLNSEYIEKQEPTMHGCDLIGLIIAEVSLEL